MSGAIGSKDTPLIVTCVKCGEVVLTAPYGELILHPVLSRVSCVWAYANCKCGAKTAFTVCAKTSRIPGKCK